MKPSLKKLVLLTTLPSFLLAGALPAVEAAQPGSQDRYDNPRQPQAAREGGGQEMPPAQHLLRNFAQLIQDGEENPTLRFFNHTGIPRRIARDVEKAFPGYHLNFQDTRRSAVEAYEMPGRILPGSAVERRVFLLRQRLQPTPGSQNPQEITLSTLWAMPLPGSNTPAILLKPTGPEWIAAYDRAMGTQGKSWQHTKFSEGQRLQDVRDPVPGVVEVAGTDRVLGIFANDWATEEENGKKTPAELYSVARQKMSRKALPRILYSSGAWQDPRAWQLFKPLVPNARPRGVAESLHIDLSEKHPIVEILGKFTKHNKRYTVLSLAQGVVYPGDPARGDGTLLTYWLLPEDEQETPRLLFIPPGYQAAKNLQHATTEHIQRIVDSIDTGQENPQETKQIQELVDWIEHRGKRQQNRRRPATAEVDFSDHAVAVLSIPGEGAATYPDSVIPYDPQWYQNQKRQDYLQYAFALQRQLRQPAEKNNN